MRTLMLLAVLVLALPARAAPAPAPRPDAWVVDFSPLVRAKGGGRYRVWVRAANGSWTHWDADARTALREAKLRFAGGCVAAGNKLIVVRHQGSLITHLEVVRLGAGRGSLPRILKRGRKAVPARVPSGPTLYLENPPEFPPPPPPNPLPPLGLRP
jgi:hypothetical protein